MDSPTLRLAALSAGWAAYGAVHSVLAAAGPKAWAARTFPGLVRAYRLAYNLLAAVLLLPLAWGALAQPGPWLWRWEGAWAWAAQGLAGAALLALLAGTGYDLGAFLGLRQLQGGPDPDAGAFRIATLHRFVRHPWYAAGLVWLWTRDMDAARLVSAGWITLYLIVGSRLEERALARRFPAYARYAARVGGLVPRPWKVLSRAEARALEEV